MSKFVSDKDNSRVNWGRNFADPNKTWPGDGAVQLGCLQRIADATEAMASNYQRLIDERNMYKRWHEEACVRESRLQRQLSAAKGQITKLKKAHSEKSA